jgi:arylsulfatase K
MDHPAAHTPNMDRLAERGVLFTNTYCNSPQCCPSRASMWSGRYVHQVEAWNNYKGIEPTDPTWRTHLDDAGYATQTFGKTDYVSGHHSVKARVTAWTASADVKVPKQVPSRPFAKITDERVGGRRRDWQTVDESLAWLDENARDAQPFMLYSGLNLPHPPFTVGEEWLERIDPDAIAMPPYEPDLHPVMDFMRMRKGCLGEFSEREIRMIRRVYCAMVAELDAMVGKLLDKLEALDLWDSTYVIYLSDHGEMAMEHRQHLKNSLYEPSARVPMMIAGPDVEQGARVDDLVSLIDVYPTLMDMAGMALPDGLEGVSLMPELHGERAPGRPDYVFSEYHSNFQNTSSFMLRRGNWKYIAYDGYEPQLFDLQSDPYEMTNLVDARPDRVEAMDADLRAIVDYPQVADQVRAYNKASFIAWREQMPPEEVEMYMSDFFAGWGPALKADIEAWLNEA